ncbi:hypothetical protein N781_12845 [Pontibacillus halophilus JSM 076056 = DSM 19796]|uniref:YlbE-like protein n=1 Tax=Pontibacillus halophilus JSM 076056 = DSM 19796 TaxID=1385510 RepID=A0A0A5GPV8_9BACI|nr:YlbE-like family protein [Pontibacillus halophilus]KGX93288.1 hypothetical protein N781_12845 [Pontibacillus halophilus JSM 076056 = DSM 19796]
MQPGVYQYLRNREDLLRFMRMNPDWYRRVTRDPSVIQNMEEEAKFFYGKTTTQRIEKLSTQVQMVNMLISMAQAMKG